MGVGKNETIGTCVAPPEIGAMEKGRGARSGEDVITGVGVADLAVPSLALGE